MAAAIYAAIQRIADLIIEEAYFLNGVNEEVEQLQVELRRMLCLLKDADHLQHHDQRLQNWVSEIRNLAYEAEDVIDTFLVKVTMNRRRRGVYAFIKNTICNISLQFQLHNIGTQIITIKNRIANISTSMLNYGIKFASEGEGSTRTNPLLEMQHRLRRSYPHIQEEHVLSFNEITKHVLNQLTKEEEQLCVVSIVGMGGLGKTTLAKKVYNHSHIKQLFGCYSWVFLSQQFSPKDVLVGILMDVASFEDRSRLEKLQQKNTKLNRMIEEQQFMSTLERMKEEDLVRALYTVLEEKRYFVVLDDIWKSEAWDCLKSAFPNGKKGSKVLFTTRNREVALLANPRSPPIEPPLLTNDQGWKLLRSKALIENGCVRELETLGRDMVKKCGGLPLAIVVLGGLLATKKSLKEWEVVHANVNAQFIKLQQGEQYGGVHGILALSYHDLPFHLKPCFLYLSQSPEDSEIHKRTLIRLWIAEGFISQPQAGEANRTMEDLGEVYLQELVNRCMVEVSQVDHTGMSPKTCRIHDLVREMCILKSKAENFLEIIEQKSPTTIVHSATSNSRRIAIHPRICGHHHQMEKLFARSSNFGNPKLRSLFYYAQRYQYRLSKQPKAFIFKNFKLLRVLIIDNIFQNFVNMPKAIGNLSHLRYLGLRRVGVSGLRLPISVGNLRSLYTLDLRWNKHISLHDILKKLECLRHLLVDSKNLELQLHEIEQLETLKTVRAQTLIRNNRMLNFPNLRNMGLLFSKEVEVMMIPKYPIFGLNTLRSLNIHNQTKSLLPMQPFSDCHHLTKLKIEGSIYDNLEFLPASLTKLTLKDSDLEQDPIEKLEKLPNLIFLNLWPGSYRGSQLVCCKSGFPRLEYLEIYGLSELEEWEIEKDALPCLKALSLKFLPKLKMIPQGLKSVTTLQDLKLDRMTDEFEKRVQVINGIEGEDFHKVRHVPSIKQGLDIY